MLLELEIENYAVVEKLRVPFRAGLNLLTGETGSGKSIVVDALSLLLGARSSAGAVRTGAERARISGVFALSNENSLAALLEENGAELDGGELVVERHVQAGGRTRCWVNGRPATLGFLQALSAHLGDIHGQHEQQKLFAPREQLDLLDAFAGVERQRVEIASLYREWRECSQRLSELLGNEQERLRLLDLYRFQKQEIDSAALEADEEERLRGERGRLQNLVRLQENAALAIESLYEAERSAAAQIKTALRAAEEIERLDADRGGAERWTPGLASAQASVQDAAFELQRYLEGLEAEPSRLDQVEERLAAIEKLKRKYGATIAEVLAFAEDAGRKIAGLDSSEQNAEKLAARRRELAAKYLSASRKLSELRRRAAKRLEAAIAAELAQLALERAHFEVAFEGAEDEEHWTLDGFDRVRFDFTANAGQPLRPLSQVASGGELSRIALAIKTCLRPAGAAEGGARTLVFDEVDTGVGGRVAEAIGKRLKRLAASHQVLCVTHLPQIAGFADAHYFVDKSDRDGATVATVAELSPSERVAELARMLSGAEVTPAALENARQLLAAGGRPG